ncbi:type VI secretion system membrane subunit TssM [Oxalobacteraceae bacterium A2-2]
MMRRIWDFITDTRHLTLAALALMVVLLLLGAEVLELALAWALCAALLLLAAAALVWWWRRRRALRGSEQLGAAMAGAAAQPAGGAGAEAARVDIQALRDGVLKAIATIRGSRMGRVSGARALYELPWYMIIGNPAAGKSSAIAHSGLRFPFAEARIVQGVGGTRNCDWFFTNDAILLDTAGRYAVLDQHREEWCGFLELLKKHRSRAPINGILIAVSVAELRGDQPEAALQLARSLRKRVQDLIERLEVYAPVYVLFTKVDLVAGFSDFYAQAQGSERERAWGATMAYQRKAGSQQLLAFFEQTFDELCAGLRELSIATLGQQRREAPRPGVYTFPQEFATLRAPLRAFLATLFEENPFQFQPVFRGYYFTSALQEGEPASEQSRRIAERFKLTVPEQPPAMRPGQSGYFLLDLFRKVIFADKELVSQYASKGRRRLVLGAFLAATVTLGLALGGWSWSYLGNRQLVRSVQADLEQAVRLQQRGPGLQARLEALGVLQDRIEQLERYRHERPWSLRMGLYQGDLLERKLREEYFGGVRELMLKPVAASLETLLAEMNAHAAELQPAQRVAAAPATRQFVEASPLNTEDAYNALKTYLMLADKAHAEPGHLNDQLTRHWRAWLEANRGAMPREQLIRSAERLMTFHLAQLADPSWPQLQPRLALVDQARENLRRVVRGMPARERVYGEIRARANTRYGAVTVARIVGPQDQALVAGSHAVPGAYTREAWEQYVAPAIRDAATRELQSADWVLRTAARDDLTLEGSPEQIQKGLTELYQADYVREWQQFVQGVTIADLGGFEAAVAAMNRLGDPQSSPIARLLAAIHQQTAWDQPGALDTVAREAGTGMMEWIRNHVLNRSPSIPVKAELRLDGAGLERQPGPSPPPRPGRARIRRAGQAAGARRQG